MHKYYRCLILGILMILGVVLNSCGEIEQDGVTAITTVGVQHTTASTPNEEILDDPNLQYFTMDDFSSIVIGKSTYSDVSEITGSYSDVVTRSYGGVSEYPMRDGKCVRIEYGSDYIVRHIGIATPSIDLANDRHHSIGFENYDAYITFLRDPINTRPLSDIYTSAEVKKYIQDIRDGKTPLMLPYHKGVPVALSVEADYPITSTAFIGYRLFACSSFTTVMNESQVRIYISALSEEETQMAKEMSCSELIAALHPSTPNVDSFDTRYYTAIFEDTAVVDGVSRSLLVEQSTNDMEDIFFVMDGFFIEIYSPIGTVTKDWLKDFSIVAH